MNYAKEKQENNKIKFSFEVDALEFEAAVQEAYIKHSGKYSVQGFRKGKAPRRVLERMYGESLFYEEALDSVMQNSYTEMLSKETGLEPIDRPEADVQEVGKQGTKFTAIVTVYPEIALNEYKGLTIEKAIYAITDADIDSKLAEAQERASRLIGVERPAVNGDTVTIDYSGSVDGEKFEGGTAEKQNLELGSGKFIPGFEAQVEGMKAGEERDIVLKFPEDYGAENLAGKEAVFHIKLHEVRVKEKPEIDDEFAKDVSEFDTLEEYKADIRAKILEQNKKKEDAEDENNLLKAIAETVEIDIPDIMIKQQAEELVQQFGYRLMYQGMKLEDYLKYTGMDMDALKAQYAEPAKRNVKMRLVMEAIIKTEGLQPDASKIEERIAAFAEDAKKSVEQYKQDMRREEFDYIANEVLTDTLMEFLKNNNTFI